jgi:hypothetical protein
MRLSDSTDALTTICEQLSAGRCVLFLGSEVSATYTDPSGKRFEGLPTGGQLLEALRTARKYVTADMSLTRALSMKEIHEGRHGVIDFINSHIPKAVASVPPAHQEIAKLPLSAIITTNWDQFVETALQALLNFATLIGVSADTVLAVGDQGADGGNDYELLTHPYSFSVGAISAACDSCFPVVDAAGLPLLGPEGTLMLLKRCTVAESTFRVV